MNFYFYNKITMNSIKYNDINIKTLRVDSKIKYNMKDVFNALDYDNYEDYFNDNDDNRYYSLGLLKKRFNDDVKEKDLIKYLENNNNYDFKLGDWFTDIWYPLFEQKDIIITNEIFNFIYNFRGGKCLHPYSVDKNYQNKKNYKNFLKQNDIIFNIIKYDKNILIKHPILHNELKLYDKNNLVQKTWLMLSVDNFKESVMIMNNNNSKMIRRYYIKIEIILYDYNKYINEYNIRTKNKELAKANKKALMINKFMNNAVIKSDKLEWIYIASTDQYQQDKLYKIGSTERLHKRIKNYQTGRPDLYYYVWVKPCYNSKDLDYNIQNLLKDFKYKSNKELYHGISIDDLINIVEFIMNNYDKTLEYIYEFIKNKLQNSIIKDPIIKRPLDIKSISYNIGDYTEVINIEEENNNLIRQELFNFLETINDKTTIKRCDLINNLKINMNKIDIWNELKELLKWKTSKDLLKYNDKEFYLRY
ncbi:N1R/p28-like protein [Choristoneura rosaceana entomopoxvirus 'L']|uniref:N1R/p28-like protein n=1 Tax=Choristoneura rosaceana entomopoxvirus 'L' TaxID=1293539 RepID=A0ABM9QKP7_9POXV|nr:N1R/p28-like protein [Choristoneura rosaceana entomopoxvirus 'L']CCU56121.1 N1R/p28-like protein [Choristoneura rosaceana entomopoxvirus 'L']